MSRLALALALLLLLTACSGITPRQPYNHREEGPPGGLFSGPSGAWTIGVGGSQPTPPVSHSPSPTPSLTK